MKFSLTTLTALLITLPAPPTHSQQLAYIRGASDRDNGATGEQGNAWLFNRGGACYALTPLHVLYNGERNRDDRYARLVVARPRGSPREAQGDRCAIFPSLDLALLRVTGIANIEECGLPLVGLPNIDALLSQNAQASLMTSSTGGSLIRSLLNIRAAPAGEGSYFWTSPASGQDRLTQGMSGGLISIQDRFAGMLLAVNNTAGDIEYGMAKVVRSDRAAAVLADLFARRGNAQIDNPLCLEPAGDRTTKLPGTTNATLNRANKSCGAETVAWSSPPLSEDNRPENLLKTDGTKVWRTTPGSEDTTVDIRLCAAKPSVVSQVQLDASNCSPNENSNYDVEILIGTGTTTPTISLGSSHMPQNQTAGIRSGTGITGDLIRLRIVPRTPKRGAICLGALQVQ